MTSDPSDSASPSAPPAEPPSSNAVFRIADQHMAAEIQLNPILATMLGVAGSDDRFPDYTPDGALAIAELGRATLGQLADTPATSPAARRCRDLMIERLSAQRDAFELGDWARQVGVFTGVSAEIRSVFDLMRRASDDDWAVIARRLVAVPGALAAAESTLREGISRGLVAPRRQAIAQGEQCATWAADGWCAGLAAEARQAGAGERVVEQLEVAGTAADAAFAAHGEFLTGEYHRAASPADGCGAEAYRVHARTMTGADLDPMEMYHWGWAEYLRLAEEIRQVCNTLLPGASFAEVVEMLETDPGRAQHSVESYQRWLQELTDDARVRGAEHFDIPEAMNRCEAQIPPEGSGAAAYYTPPTEDFSRPGQTWWPTLGRSAFPMWSDVSTCYHESVPGHHLQVAYAMLQRDQLSRYQRTMFIPGHGEGWALYAEQLCDELGWFDNPDHRLGYLAAQQLRAVRVVVDIGMHLRLPIPDGAVLSDGTPFHPGEIWDAELALRFAMAETGNTEEYMRSEIDRYLGWPAQAISYKIGQREWLKARAEAQQSWAERFDLRAFHTFALGLGAIGLDQLRREIGAFQPG